jgi:heat shock protein HslJ
MLRIILIFFLGIQLVGCNTTGSSDTSAVQNNKNSEQQTNNSQDKGLQDKSFTYDQEAILDKLWQWESTTTPVDEIIVISPENYTMFLASDGKARMRFDCNRGSGAYEISKGKISFGLMASTRMACSQASQNTDFVRGLEEVSSFFVKDRNLYLELPYDSGTMKFGPGENN